MHLYGKELRPGRKVGHVNAYGDDLDDCLERARHAAAWFRGDLGDDERVSDHDVTTAERDPAVGIVMGSDSDWPVMEAAAEALDEFGIPYEADVVSAHRMPEEMLAYGRRPPAAGSR